MDFWDGLPAYLRSTFWILVVTISLILSVAFTTLWERKVIGWVNTHTWLAQVLNGEDPDA